jgi:hypothetical protein
MRRALRVVIVVLMLPAFWTTARELFPYVNYALATAHEPIDARREEVWGHWYADVRTVAPDASVDVVMANPQARDNAVFVAAALAPRVVFIYDSMDARRRLQPAKLYVDPVAVNESMRPKKHGDVVLVVQP